MCVRIVQLLHPCRLLQITKIYIVFRIFHLDFQFDNQHYISTEKWEFECNADVFSEPVRVASFSKGVVQYKTIVLQTIDEQL